MQGGGDVDKHERLGVAPEARLKEVGELGVAVGDVLLLVANGDDHVTWEYKQDQGIYKQFSLPEVFLKP